MMWLILERAQRCTNRALMCWSADLGKNDRYTSAVERYALIPVGVAGIISLRQQKDAAFAKRPLDTFGLSRCSAALHEFSLISAGFENFGL